MEKAILAATGVVVTACVIGANVAASSGPVLVSHRSASHDGESHGHATHRWGGQHRGGLRGLTAEANCTLEVPARPLTAKGLATPYVLHSAGSECSEGTPGTAAFVQAVILDKKTGDVQVYNPVVVDEGDKPAEVPPVPKLPRNAVVSIWTGFNGDVLKLTGRGSNRFVNFAQQSYANSPQFFRALSSSISHGRTTVPPLGTDRLGDPCPTTRDFSVVDQDPSDNVTVAYPEYGTENGSDDNLLTYVDQVIGCTPWTVPVAYDSRGLKAATAGQLLEMQAALQQGEPSALVPGLDPFVTVNGKPDLRLLNLYRAQLGQPRAHSADNTKAYCEGMASAGAPRLARDASMESAAPVPPFASGTDMASMLAHRFASTWDGLTCPALTGSQSPIQVDESGHVTYP